MNKIKNFVRDYAMPVLLVIAFIVLVIGLWVVPSYFEARAYNRITGSNVSTFDAMFVQLRVQGEVKSDD